METAVDRFRLTLKLIHTCTPSLGDSIRHKSKLILPFGHNHLCLEIRTTCGGLQPNFCVQKS